VRCPACWLMAQIKDRPLVRYIDPPVYGCPNWMASTPDGFDHAKRPCATRPYQVVSGGGDDPPGAHGKTLHVPHRRRIAMVFLAGCFTAGLLAAVPIPQAVLARFSTRLGPDGQAITTETLRRRYLSLPGRLTRSARRVTVHLPARWPWAEQFVAALTGHRNACSSPEPSSRRGPSTRGRQCNHRTKKLWFNARLNISWSLSAGTSSQTSYTSPERCTTPKPISGSGLRWAIVVTDRAFRTRTVQHGPASIA
jgi:hypothetical protein